MKKRTQMLNFPLVEFIVRAYSASAISARGIMLMVIYYIKLLLVMPVTFLQYFLYRRRLRRTVIEKDPVFILGHYRSGTTYLHKLMGADKQFGFISYYDILCPNTSLLFGKWLQKLLQSVISKLKIKTAFFNNSIPDLSDPAEEERFLINKGSAYTDYWRFVFPRSWNKFASCADMCVDEKYFDKWSNEYMLVLKLATLKSKGRQLVLKSPENTGRIRVLLKMFPNAKIIYISRNPVDVYYSMMNLWQRAIKKFALQQIQDTEIQAIIFSHYIKLLNAYKKDKALIPAANLVEIRYDELCSKPLSVLGNIYKELSLPGYSEALSSFKMRLRKECSYNPYSYPRNANKEIQEYWKQYINEWNYKNASTGNLVIPVDSVVAVQECDATM